MKKKNYIPMVITSVVAATLSACGSSSASSKATYQKSISWMTTSEIETMDPNTTVDTASGEQETNTFEGLFRLGKNGKVKPGIAKTAAVSKDGLTWTFTLRKNAYWSNGKKVTAQDFVCSWQRAVNPKTGAGNTTEYQVIKNAVAITEGKKSASSLGVKAVGKYKLVVELVHPVPYFKTIVASGMYPVSKTAVEKFGKKYGTASKYQYYDGPFVQKGWTGSNLTWKLVKNKYYWDKQAVKLQTVNYSVEKTASTDYNLYQSKKLDAALLDTSAASQLKKSAGYTVRDLDNTYYLNYNIKKVAIFKNADLRRAISLAINRQALVNTVGSYNKTAQTMSSASMAIGGQNFAKYVVSQTDAAKYSKYSKKQAQKYFAAALKKLGEKSIFFTIMGDDDDMSKKAVEYLQSALNAAFGNKINVSVKSLPKTNRISHLMNGTYQLCFMSLTTDAADPYEFLKYMHSSQTYNFGSWNNSAYDKIVDASNSASSDKKRLQELAKAEEILAKEQGITPLFHLSQAWMIRPNVHGVVFTGSANDFKTAYATSENK